jgi:hypothetical protein
MIEYDTIKIWTKTELIDVDSLLLGQVNFETKIDGNGKRRYHFRLKNLNVSIGEEGVTKISGSIPKFIHGNNLHPLNIQDIQKFQRYVQNFFKIESREFKVSRIDLGMNLEMNEHPSNYLFLIGGAVYKEYGHFEDTVYLKTKTKTNRIYDKSKEVALEMGDNHINEKRNFLRLEFSIKNDIARHLKYPFPTLYDLDKKTFIDACTNYVIREFEGIRFSSICPNPKQIRTPKDFMDYLIICGVQYLSNSEMEKLLKVLRKSKAFNQPYHVNRIRTNLKRKMKKHDLQSATRLVEELQNRFYQKINS